MTVIKYFNTLSLQKEIRYISTKQNYFLFWNKFFGLWSWYERKSKAGESFWVWTLGTVLISVLSFISEPQGDQDLHAHPPRVL